jgi:hypothetical protein
MIFNPSLLVSVALYGSLILHVQPAIVCCMAVKALKGIKNLKTSLSRAVVQI